MSVFCEKKSNLQNKCFFFDNKKYTKLMKVSFPILSLLFLKKKCDETISSSEYKSG